MSKQENLYSPVRQTDQPLTPRSRAKEVDVESRSSSSSKQGITGEGMFTLDSYLEQIGFGGYHLSRFLSVGFLAFMDGAVIMALSLSLVILKTEWAYSSETESIVASLVFVSVVLGAYSSGPIADHYGRRFPMLISCFAICIFNLASAFSPNIIIYTIFRSFLAFGLGFYSPIGFAYILEIMPPSARGKIVTAGYAMLFIGELYVCIISLFALESLTEGNWRAMTIWSTVPAVISMLVSVLYLDESIRYLLINKRYNEAFAGLQQSANGSWNSKIKLITEGHKKQLIQWVDYQEFLSNKTKRSKASIRFLLEKGYRRTTLILWVSWFVISFTYYGLTLFFPYILSAVEADDTSTTSSNSWISKIESLADDSLASYTISIGLESISVVIAYFVIDSKFLGRKGGMVAFFGAAAFFSALAFVNRSKLMLIIWTTCVKIMIDVVTFYCYLLTLEVYPTKFRATGIGAATAVGKAGTVLMPWVCAVLLQWSDYGPYLGFFIVTGFSSVCCAILPRREKEEMR